MDDLKILRQEWKEAEMFETEILRKQSIFEKVSDYLQLLAEFGVWNQQIEQMYQEERERALAELQIRLRRLHYVHAGE